MFARITGIVLGAVLAFAATAAINPDSQVVQVVRNATTASAR